MISKELVRFACSCLELCCPDQSGQVRRDTTFDVVLTKAAIMFDT